MKRTRPQFILFFFLFAINLVSQTEEKNIDQLIYSNQYIIATEVLETKKNSNLSTDEKVKYLHQQAEIYYGLEETKKAVKQLSLINELIEKNPNSDDSKARYTLIKAKLLRSEKKYAEAKEILKVAALDLSHKNIEPLITTQVFYLLARSYRGDKNIDSTVLIVDQGLKLLDNISNNADRNYAHIDLLSEKASAYSKSSQYNKSRKFFKRIIEIATEENDTLIIAKNNKSIAFGYFYSGDFGKCKYYIEQSMALNIEKFGPTSSQALSDYQNLAVVFTKLQNYEDANVYYAKSYDIIKELKGEESIEISRLHFNIGIGHYQKQEYEEALIRFNKSLAIRKKLLDPNDPDVAHSYQIIGSTLLNQYKYDEALIYYNQALAIRENIKDYRNPDMIRLYNNMASIKIEKGDLSMAKKYVSKAYEGMGYNNKKPLNFDILSNPFMLSNPLESDIEIASLEYSKKPSIENYKSAVKKTTIGDSLMNYMKYYLDDPGSRKAFRQKQKILYDEMLNVFALRYDQDKDHDAAANVFRLIEKGNNGMIYEKIAADNSTTQLGMPQSVLDDKYEIEDSLAYYENLMLADGNNENPDILKQITYFKTKYFDFLATMKKEYPKFFESIYDFPIVDLDGYQRILAPNETSITYYHGIKNSFALVIDNDQITLHRLGTSLDINVLLTEYIMALKDRENTNNYAAISSKLYEILISPLALDKTIDLTIIADGLYGLIPFELLRKSENDPFLFEKMTVSYQYSATMRSQEENKATIQSNILAMAPVFENQDNVNQKFASVIPEDIFRDNMNELIGSESELRSINKLYAGEYYYRSMATEAKFKASAPSSSIIHLATHGYVNHENADKSRLYFLDDTISGEDGQLNAYEIMGMDLSNTQLVTLSACNTGVGAIQKGEGVASLGRAFAYAGCQNQLISLWPANDKSTTSIMSHYYSNLKNGQGKSESLKNAKLAYLSEAPQVLKHPYYWAGFVYYGDDNPLRLNSEIDYMKWGILGICLLGLIFMMKKYKWS